MVLERIKKLYFNFQPYILPIFSMGGLALYIATKNTIGHNNFFSDNPVIFYIIISAFFFVEYFFAMASKSPGYCTKEPDDTDGLFYCEYVGYHIPLRSCYCKICKKVILRKDHHCPWTGNCIGRDNYLYFLIFTLTLPILCLFGFIDEARAMIYNYKTEDNFIYTSWPGYILLPVCFFTTTSVTRIFFDTMKCIKYGVTRWESAYANKISYLEGYAKENNPFNHGFWNNLSEVLTMASDKKEWKKPEPISLQELRRTNIQ